MHAARQRARIADRVPASLRRLAAVPGVRSDVGLAACTRVLVGIEPVIPPPAEIDALLTRVRPDVLLVTPLVELGSPNAGIPGERSEAQPPIEIGVVAYGSSSITMIWCGLR